MDIHHIRYFLAVCETRNFTRAAEKCNVTQPALSRAIQQLEDEVGGRLFRRERNLTHVTDLGNLLRPRFQQVQDELLGVRTEVTDRSALRELAEQLRDKLESVDLRYDRQIIVNPDLEGTVKQPPLSMVSAKVAASAGVKPAALITHQTPGTRQAVPSTVASKSSVAATRKSSKKSHHKATAKAKPAAAHTQTESVAKASPPPVQAPSSTPTPAPKATAPTAGTVAVKPGSKPSPAIAKGEGNP